MQRGLALEPKKPERVLVTGNAGILGQGLVKRLLKDKTLRIIGVDRRPLTKIPPGLEHYALDLRRKSALQTLYKIKPESIIHLGVVRNPQVLRNKRAEAHYFNLESMTQLLRLAENVPIRKFVFLSTANLYGPSANTAGLLTEDTPLHGANKNPEFRDLVALDMMVQSFFWKQPDTQTIILRPCHIVGPRLKNAPSRYLLLDTIPTILGFDPMMQLIHERDLMNAIALSLSSDMRGIFNISGPDVAPLSRIIRALGRPTVPLPERLLKALAAGTFFSKKGSFPSGELDHLKYSCIIDDRRARQELGFKPKVGLSTILEALKVAYEKEKSLEAVEK